MPIPELIKLFGLFTLLYAALTSGLVSVAKALFGKALEAALVSHRVRLESEATMRRVEFEAQAAANRAQLEREAAAHRAILEHDSRLAAERLRSELAIVAHESQARTTSLVNRQGEVIAEMYRLLVDAEAHCQRTMSGTRWSNEPTAEERAPDTVAAIIAFTEYFDRNRIFLTATATKPLAEIRQYLNTAWKKFVTFGIEPRDDGLQRERSKLQENAREIVCDTIPIAKTRLEVQLRRLLGVRNEESTDDSSNQKVDDAEQAKSQES